MGHFLEGAGSILPEKCGAAPEKWTPELTWLNRTRQESLTTSIVENRWRTYIYIYIVLLSSIFVKHALNSHFRCPKNCSIARKKNYFARLWGLQPTQPPPSSYAYACSRSFCWTPKKNLFTMYCRPRIRIIFAPPGENSGLKYHGGNVARRGLPGPAGRQIVSDSVGAFFLSRLDRIDDDIRSLKRDWSAPNGAWTTKRSSQERAAC